MLSQQVKFLILIVSILGTSKLIYAQAYEARELLDGRWYETEIIIFEYLSTLSINEPENLVINLARSRPKNITTNNTPLARLRRRVSHTVEAGGNGAAYLHSTQE